MIFTVSQIEKASIQSFNKLKNRFNIDNFIDERIVIQDVHSISKNIHRQTRNIVNNDFYISNEQHFFETLSNMLNNTDSELEKIAILSIIDAEGCIIRKNQKMLYDVNEKIEEKIRSIDEIN